MVTSVRHIATGLSLAVVFFTVAMVIRPQGLAANDGLSYYGSFRTTIIPYSLAFLASAYYYWQTALTIQKKPSYRHQLAPALKFMAVLCIGLLVTPHTLVDPIHTAIGSTLFAFQLVVSVWLLVVTRWRWQIIAGTAIELLSGIAALHYLPKPHGLLLQTQVIFQLAFGLLLMYALNLTQFTGRE